MKEIGFKKSHCDLIERSCNAMQYPPFGFFWWHCSSCSKVDALVLKRPQDKTSFGFLTVMRPWTMEVPYFCQKRSIVRVQILKWSEGQRIDLRKKVMHLLINYPKNTENFPKVAQKLPRAHCNPLQGQNRDFPVYFFPTGKNLFLLQGSQLMETSFSLWEKVHRENPVFLTGMGLQCI